MAVGDMAGDNQLVTTGAFLDIQPSSTIEWVIHNVYHEAEIEVHWFDGTNDIQGSGALSGPATEANLQLHAKNTLRPRIKNVNAGSKRIGWDGIVTHA